MFQNIIKMLANEDNGRDENDGDDAAEVDDNMVYMGTSASSSVPYERSKKDLSCHCVNRLYRQRVKEPSCQRAAE